MVVLHLKQSLKMASIEHPDLDLIGKYTQDKRIIEIYHNGGDWRTALRMVVAESAVWSVDQDLYMLDVLRAVAVQQYTAVGDSSTNVVPKLLCSPIADFTHDAITRDAITRDSDEHSSISTSDVDTSHIATSHIATSHIATSHIATSHIVTSHIATSHIASSAISAPQRTFIYESALDYGVPIFGHRGFLVSRSGVVTNEKTRLPTSTKKRLGETYVYLSRSLFPLAHIVADAYIPVSDPAETVLLYIDGNKNNCAASNLRRTVPDNIPEKKTHVIEKESKSTGDVTTYKSLINAAKAHHVCPRVIRALTRGISCHDDMLNQSIWRWVGKSTKQSVEA